MYTGPMNYAATMTPTDAPTTRSISDARNAFADVIALARFSGHITYLTARGKTVAAVVGADDAQRLGDRGSRDIPMSDARNELAEIIGQARYNGEVTYLLSIRKRVAAIVSVADAKRIEAERAG